MDHLFGHALCHPLRRALCSALRFVLCPGCACFLSEGFEMMLQMSLGILSNAPARPIVSKVPRKIGQCFATSGKELQKKLISNDKRIFNLMFLF